MNGRPLVSIIVPSYNQGRFIGRTIESILRQDYRPIEVWVMDGASTDETLRVLDGYRDVPELQLVSEPDSGVVEAVNKGFARATGEFAAIQSSDDFYLPGAITAAIAALQADPALAFVYGDIRKVDADGRELARTQIAPYSLEALLTMQTWVPQPATFFRLGLAKQLGGWRSSVPYAADTDLWLRMALQHPACKLDRLMAERTMHEAQRDKQGARIMGDYAKAIDSLPGIGQASVRIRRAAAAGKLLLANRYDPAAGSWTRIGRTWRAIWQHPPLLRRTPVGGLVPGWWLLQRALRAVKRQLVSG